MSKGEGRKIAIKFTANIINTMENSNITFPEHPAISGHTTQTAYGSTSTINIPEEANPGDLLIMFWAKDDDPIESVADGWTRIFTSYDTYHRVSIHYKFYEGESRQFTLSHDSEETSAIVVSIPGALEPVVSNAFYGTTQNPTPPSLSSGFDTDTPTLWFAFAGCDSADVVGFPSNFVDNNIASNRSGVGLGVASLVSSNSSEAPNNFTLSASEQTSAGMLAIRLKSKEDMFKDAFKSGFSVTGKEYKYVNGPLLDKEFLVISAEHHPTEPKSLLLEVDNFTRFHNSEGPITVSYDAQKGILLGLGGAVESFVKTFTPTNLEPEPNPHAEEYLNPVIGPVTFEWFVIEELEASSTEEHTVKVYPATVTVEYDVIDIENP